MCQVGDSGSIGTALWHPPHKRWAQGDQQGDRLCYTDLQWQEVTGCLETNSEMKGRSQGHSPTPSASFGVLVSVEWCSLLGQGPADSSCAPSLWVPWVPELGAPGLWVPELGW